MAAIDEDVLASFEREFTKTALPLRGLLTGAGRLLRKGVGSAGSGMGLGTGVGALAGAAKGGYEGYQQDKELGGSGWGGALSGAGEGAMSGAATGAAVGGGVGLAAGAKGGRLANALTGAAKRKGPVGSFARFGQRQVHGFTGMVPGGAQRGTAEYRKAFDDLKFSGGSKDVANQLAGAEKQLQKAQAAGNTKAVNKATKALERTKSRYQTALETEDKGLTNLPGMLRSMGSKDGVKDIWRLGVKPQLKDQGIMGKAMVAVPLAAAGSEAMTSQADDPEGRGRAERTLGALGSAAGYTVAPLMPISAVEAMGRGLGTAGEYAGKGIDKAWNKLSG